jgi:hypothetical protein
LALQQSFPNSATSFRAVGVAINQITSGTVTVTSYAICTQ